MPITDYEFIKKLGRGSYGDVDLVRLKNTEELYVMKVIPIVANDPNFSFASAQKEAIFLKRLDHPFIVGFRECFKGIPSNRRSVCFCIVMEFANGGDVAHLIKQRLAHPDPKLLPEQQILYYVTQLICAIKYLHDRRIVHRDIKAENVFLTCDNFIKIGDFGISKTLENTYALARTKIGTPYYLSPEICRDQPYNRKSDMWALGVLIYYLCALRPPFDLSKEQANRPDSMKLLTDLIEKGTYPPLCSEYSPQLRSLVDDLLQKNPKDRPSIHVLLNNPFIRQQIYKFLGAKYLESSFVKKVRDSLNYDTHATPSKAEEPEHPVDAPQASVQAPLRSRRDENRDSHDNYSQPEPRVKSNPTTGIEVSRLERQRNVQSTRSSSSSRDHGRLEPSQKQHNDPYSAISHQNREGYRNNDPRYHEPSSRGVAEQPSSVSRYSRDSERDQLSTRRDERPLALGVRQRSSSSSSRSSAVASSAASRAPLLVSQASRDVNHHRILDSGGNEYDIRHRHAARRAPEPEYHHQQPQPQQYQQPISVRRPVSPQRQSQRHNLPSQAYPIELGEIPSHLQNRKYQDVRLPTSQDPEAEENTRLSRLAQDRMIVQSKRVPHTSELHHQRDSIRELSKNERRDHDEISLQRIAMRNPVSREVAEVGDVVDHAAGINADSASRHRHRDNSHIVYSHNRNNFDSNSPREPVTRSSSSSNRVFNRGPSSEYEYGLENKHDDEHENEKENPRIPQRTSSDRERQRLRLKQIDDHGDSNPNSRNIYYNQREVSRVSTRSSNPIENGQRKPTITGMDKRSMPMPLPEPESEPESTFDHQTRRDKDMSAARLEEDIYARQNRRPVSKRISSMGFSGHSQVPQVPVEERESGARYYDQGSDSISNHPSRKINHRPSYDSHSNQLQYQTQSHQNHQNHQNRSNFSNHAQNLHDVNTNPREYAQPELASGVRKSRVERYSSDYRNYESAMHVPEHSMPSRMPTVPADMERHRNSRPKESNGPGSVSHPHYDYRTNSPYAEYVERR